MSDLFAAVNGHHATSVTLHVANVGPWFADCELDEQVALSGPVVLQFGSSALSGTVAPDSSGGFGLTSKVRVVAGGGGWGRELVARAYHNDAGVRAFNIANDAAREAGETMGAFAPSVERVGVDYVRRIGPASRALEDAAGEVPWWVGYDGKTNVGPRPAKTLAAGDFDLLSFDHNAKLATLGVDEPAKLEIGGILTSDRIEAPLTIRELEFTLTSGSLRVQAWCGGDEGGEGRLERLFTAVVERIVARKLFGRYEYRVFRMAPDGRVDLQAVSKSPGLPDLLPVSQKPGVAGWHAELAPGAVVHVEFLAGDATRPVVTGYGGKGEDGHTPVSLSFGAGSAEVARKGDAVEVLLPPAVFSGTIGVAPATGVLTFPTMKTLGTITTGRAELKA